MTRADLADKAAFVRAALRELEGLPKETLQELLADRRNVPAALHWLQTAVQALVDIGLIVAAGAGLRTPRTSVDVLESLEEAGLLPPGSSARFRPVIGFRNRVVHLYDRIDPAILLRVLAEDLPDLEELLRLLLAAGGPR